MFGMDFVLGMVQCQASTSGVMTFPVGFRNVCCPADTIFDFRWSLTLREECGGAVG
jgi:hypothetical protein